MKFVNGNVYFLRRKSFSYKKKQVDEQIDGLIAVGEPYILRRVNNLSANKLVTFAVRVWYHIANFYSSFILTLICCDIHYILVCFIILEMIN